MGLSDFYSPTTAIGDLRADINALKLQKAEKHEISTLTNDVIRLANSISVLGDVVHALLVRLEQMEALLCNIHDTQETQP